MEEIRKTKYSSWYNALIEKRVKDIPDGYTERHHIVPRCIGGTDDKSNIVCLTAREHFIAHLLLTKMYPDNRFITSKMVRAYIMMAFTFNLYRINTYRKNSRTFELLRKAFSKIQQTSQKGEKNNNFDNIWIYNKTLMQTKIVKKSTVLEEGWSYGRVLNWNSFFSSLERKKRVLKHSEEKKICKNCKGKFFSKRNKTFCNRSCNNNYRYGKDPVYITISRDGCVKHIKRENFPAYKNIGWKKVI